MLVDALLRGFAPRPEGGHRVREREVLGTLVLRPRSSGHGGAPGRISRTRSATFFHGGIGVNAWPGALYGLVSPTWGAFPGHNPEKYRLGDGRGAQRVALRPPEKSVLRMPFRRPKPAWFADQRISSPSAGAWSSTKRTRPGARSCASPSPASNDAHQPATVMPVCPERTSCFWTFSSSCLRSAGHAEERLEAHAERGVPVAISSAADETPRTSSVMPRHQHPGPQRRPESTPRSRGCAWRTASPASSSHDALGHLERLRALATRSRAVAERLLAPAGRSSAPTSATCA